MTAPTALLETRALSCGHHPRRPVLHDVDLAVHRGATTVLVGPSGCGKSTLVKTVLGLLPPLAGGARVLGHELASRPPAGRVGYVPQGLGLVAHRSVLHNVLAGTLAETGRVRGVVGWHPPQLVRRAREALERVGLAELAGERPLHLSGGQRRRVAVARALAGRPVLLIADEVLSELDATTAATVLEAIRDLQREVGTGVLMVEHDLERSNEVADLLCCLGHGGLRATLPPASDRARRAREVVDACATPPTA